MPSGKRILVTGAAGFIGSHTVERLVSDGYRVLGVDDLSTGREENLAEASKSGSFDLARADIAEPGALGNLVTSFKPHSVVHLAALVSVPRGEEDPALNHRLNVHATHVVCEAARLHGIRRVVFASSAAVYGECSELPLREASPTVPVSQYGSAKRISEQLLASYAHSYGIETVSFRYFNIYGPRQDPASPYSGVVSIFCDRFRSGQPVTIFGDGSQSRDFVFVGDVASVNAAAATNDAAINGTFNCCTGASTSLLDLVSLLDERYPGNSKPNHAAERVGDIRHSLGKPSALKVALGFKPETTFKTGIQSLLDPTA